MYVCMYVHVYVGWFGLPGWSCILYSLDTSESLAGYQDWKTQYRDDGTERSASQGKMYKSTYIAVL